MKNLLIVIIFFSCFCLANSQSNWFWQNPLPQGNSLRSLNVFDENSSMCFSGKNFLKTNDGGQNWNLFYTGFPNDMKSVSMLDQNTGYMLLDPNILIKTTNGGVNWNFVNHVTTSRYPVSIKFLTPDLGFLFSRDSVYIHYDATISRTTNGGITWNFVLDSTGYEIHDVYFLDQSTGYAAGSRDFGFPTGHKLKFLKTTDGGIRWDTIPNNIKLNPLSLYFLDENTGYLAGGGNPHIYKTTTGGITWDAVNSPSASYIVQVQFLNYSTGYAIRDWNLIFKTTNSGTNWTQLNNYSESVKRVCFINSNIAYAVGDGGLIIKTVNGGTNWTSQSKSSANLYLEDIKFSDVNTGFVGGENGTLLKTINGGSNWDLIQFSISNELISISNLNSTDWFVASYYGKIFKTTNTGLTWDTLYYPYGGITRMEFVNAQTGFGVYKYYRFIRTTNGGLTWISDTTFNVGQNWSLDFIDENTGYAGGDRTRKTTDGGQTWKTVNLGGNYYSADIQFVNFNTGFIASDAGSSGGMILKTTDAGLNWQRTFLGNYDLIDIYFLNERIGFALNGSEVFKTINGGDNWFSIPTCSGNYLSVIYYTDSLNGYCIGDNGTIIKTTNGGGDPVGIEPVTLEVPENFILHQNYPNPFNPTTIINYELRISNYILLKVYDVLGKEITTLVNEKQSPGKYEVKFNGNNFPSGIYFYTIEASETSAGFGRNFIQSKKMVLIK